MRLEVTLIPSADTVEHQHRVEQTLGTILRKLDHMAIDTSKLLASAAKQTSQNASLIALINSVKDQLTQTKQELADAIAAGDPAAIAQAQADIDTVVSKLDADDAETAAALGENVTQPGT